MECIEARALKSSFVSEIGMISSQQVCFDDVRCLASVTCDDFSVDDLFDFSDKCFEESEEEENEARDSFSSSSSDKLCNEEDQFASLQECHQLPEPVDDMENLEWLSQIVDDSRTEISLLCPVGSFKGKTGGFLENRFEPVVHRIREPCFPMPALRKPRGKRSRPNGRRAVWTFRSPSLSPESSSTASYSSYGSSTISPVFGFVNPVEDKELFSSIEKPAAKKQKKLEGNTVSGSGGSQTLRRCSHCLVQKTPQWRTGPMGPKTLCNACGVRYKSGRLFPEYRPACSPTFSREIHSNSHRKVLEMRRMKEEGEPLETGPTPGLPSF